MKFKLTILCISVLTDIPYYVFLQLQPNDDSEINASILYWTGLFRVLMMVCLPLAVTFLIIDRLLVIFLMGNRSQEKLFYGSCVVMGVTMVTFVVISIVIEKPEVEWTSKFICKHNIVICILNMALNL